MAELMIDLGMAPDWGASKEPEVKVVQVSFGDGYEYRAPAGINHVKDSWSLTWSNLSMQVAEQGYSWFKSRQGWKAFMAQDPATGQAIKVVCRSVRVAHAGFEESSLSVTVSQDFNP